MYSVHGRGDGGGGGEGERGICEMACRVLICLDIGLTCIPFKSSRNHTSILGFGSDSITALNSSGIWIIFHRFVLCKICVGPTV